MKQSGDLQKLLTFINFTHKFQQIKRHLYATGEDRDEDDADHSFQLALVSWYLTKSNQLAFDENKLIQYALVHDLVEVYAGDTFAYTTDRRLKESKIQREKEALEIIRKQFTEFPELAELIYTYELRNDPEAKFIYALDKILPALNNILDQGKSWHRDHVTYKMVRTNDEKITVSPEAMKLWKMVIRLLDENPDLFPKDK